MNRNTFLLQKKGIRLNPDSKDHLYPEKWKDIKPMTLKNVKQYEMFTYLLDDDDKWYVAEGNGEFELVSDLLED